MIDMKQLYKSFGYAFKGIYHAFKYNQNFRIQTVGAFLVIAASIFFHVNPFEMGILGIMILLVMSTEMVNTAIEEIVDYVIREHSQEAKTAKDVAAGMVLLTFLGSIIVGTLIFIPYIMKYFNGDL